MGHLRLIPFLILAAFVSNAYAAELFHDDFSDLDYAGWTNKKGSWSAATGVLVGSTTRKTDILSNFAGCTSCTIQATVRIDSPGARVSILGWYQSKPNSVEVRLFQDRQKVLLKQRAGGDTVAKKAAPFPVSIATSYQVQVSYTAGTFQVLIDGTPVLSANTKVQPSGTVGFRVASTTGAMSSGGFDDVTVNDASLVMDSDGAVNLTADSAADDQNPAFSPDGSQLIFSSKRNGGGANLNVWKMQMNGTAAGALTSDTDTDNVNLPGSSWSPLRNKICFSSDRSGNDEIWMMDPDGTNLVQLTNNPAKDWEPSFSNDGNDVFFQSNRDGNWEIYKVNIDTLTATRLTNNTADDWEPNGSPVSGKVVFQTNRDGNWEIYTMNPDGTAQTDITNSASEDTDPSFSPDGSLIVYSSDYGGLTQPHIFLIRSDGSGTPAQVTYGTAYDGAPSFSPDGKSITFESDRSGNLDIWITGYWLTVNDFAYQLQNVDLAQLGNSAFDLTITDYSSDGSEAGRYTDAEVGALKHSAGGEKLALAYMSIGEAEDYRWYWNNKWDLNHDGIPDPDAPSWLGPANPQWPGNYKVRYWDPGWQAIIFGSPSSYLDKIIDAGYDGAYLDIIDAYEYWGPGGESGLDRASAEQDMVDFVKALANYARVTRGKITFGIFPQNGDALAAHSDYVSTVSGIGEEDTWYNGNHPQSAGYTQSVVSNLTVFRQAGKLVLNTDYCTVGSLIDDFYAQAQIHSFVPYATVRDLDVLTINPGHPPD